jgi:ferric-dicitrate binding protein FerR (iron transport regulator)
VPPELEQIIGRMLAANVEHRAQSAATVAAELRSIAAIVDTRIEAAEAAEAAEPPRRRGEQRRSGLIVIVVITLLLIAAIAVWLMSRQ